MTTLAALSSGIGGSTSTPLPHRAAHVPAGTPPESRVKRFARWRRNDQITEARSFVPFAEVWLTPLALQTLVRVMEGSVVGRGWVALMLPVVYKGRALPVAWLVRHGKKGHVPEDRHIALVAQVPDLLPAGARGVLLGDGEFEGTRLQHTVPTYRWSSVVRTGSHLTVVWDCERFRCATVGACIKPGTRVALREGRVTEEAYGLLMLLCGWGKGYKDPLDLVTNMAAADEACRLSTKRVRSETFFSDQKSRGFHLHPSHIANPPRLGRFLMAACLAYIWIVSLGALCVKDGLVSVRHRSDRCDLRLCQLGLRRLEHFLNADCSIPVAFHISI